MSMKKKWGLLVAMALVFGLIAGLVMYGVNAVGNRIYSENHIAQTDTISADSSSDDSSSDSASTDSASSDSSADSQSDTDSSQSAGAGDTSVIEVTKNAMPSVVTISTMSVEEMRNFFGGTQQYQVEGAGTGVIVGKNDSELLIATNNHVVEGATSLSVGFIDESSVAAEIKGTDVNNDLAVVSVKLSDISSDTMGQIRTASVGDSDDLELGEQVVAIGNALGYGQSVTVGYVSALNRSLSLTDESGQTINSTGLIQTDAAINPGNSGGALLNMKGELIGINEAKTESTQDGSTVDNIGFAIPIDKAESSLKELMNLPTREKVDASEASYLGIEGQSVTSDVTQLYGIPGGVVVTAVEDQGPADQAGIKKGDIITELDGRSVANIEQLQDTLQYYAAGETVDVVVERADGQQYAEQTLSVTLGSAKDSGNADSSDTSGSSSSSSSSDSEASSSSSSAN